MESEADFLAKERTLLASERTLLAAERTLSAWIRTGLAGVGGGFAIIHLIEFENYLHRWLAGFSGGLLILWGIGILTYSLLDYKKSVRRLEKTAGRSISIWREVTIICGLMIVSLVLLFISIN